MDWTELLASQGPTLITALVGVAGIIGTTRSARHQAKSQSVEALRAEQRTTYAEGLVTAYAAADLLPQWDYDIMLDWTTSFDNEALAAHQQEAARIAGRCALLGDDDVRFTSAHLLLTMAGTRRIMALPFIANEAGSKERQLITEAADGFREAAQADINRTDRKLAARWRRFRHWWADRHERRAHKNLDPGPTAEDADILEAPDRGDPPF
ncbi:hypothetical protein [Tessaracoccus sp. ZS01]|uniref:hypothetical protein n=1 Tax=Tessaracoccus sp. ZS01 TaxID=1906324 RepID=UPI00096CE9B6|nr:hypothetical protein [Tessaracoccus sp. ZS01]MCG6566658.1 hypothetical protein [Tessaracoccus sp. ZS01]OMG59078.1 hypothetical protein BJN44_03315 [Tessaracoccus sp. ZS01]